MYDVAIIGAGPIGLACAIEAAKSKLNYILIDRGSFLNSLCNFPHNMKFFSTAELLEIGNIPFIVSTEKPEKDDALKYYWRVAQYYNIHMKLHCGVNSVKQHRGHFVLNTETEQIEIKKVIIATGYYDNPNMLEVPGENMPHVSHYYTHPHRHIKQKVVVVGGSNSAAIHALELYRYGIDVILVHRRKELKESVKYWIKPDIENRIEEGVIPAFFETEILEIKKNSVILNRNGEKLEIPCDFLLAMTGYHPDFKFIRNMGVSVDEKTSMPDFNKDTGETNIPGIYLAGSLQAGNNSNKIFIENGHLHAPVIIEDIMKRL